MNLKNTEFDYRIYVYISHSYLYLQICIYMYIDTCLWTYMTCCFPYHWEIKQTTISQTCWTLDPTTWDGKRVNDKLWIFNLFESYVMWNSGVSIGSSKRGMWNGCWGGVGFGTPFESSGTSVALVTRAKDLDWILNNSAYLRIHLLRVYDFAWQVH